MTFATRAPLRIAAARLVVSVGLLAGTAGCDGGPVSRPTWHIAGYELARAAAAGYPARVVLADGIDEAPNHESETLIVVAPRTVKVLPAPRFEVFTNAGFEAYLLRVWVAPYLAVSDLDGAVRAATRGYTRALEDQKVIAKGRPLPPIPDPNEWGFLYPSRNVDWGLAVTVLVFAFCAAIDRFGRSKDHRAAPP
jgi:hypothetical protein